VFNREVAPAVAAAVADEARDTGVADTHAEHAFAAAEELLQGR
jgi:hypothetical protein